MMLTMDIKLLSFIVIAIGLPVYISADCPRVVCYYTNWAQYRLAPYKFFPENIDPKMCTHIMYAFAKIVNNELVSFEWNDESTSYSEGMYQRVLTQMKSANPNVKVLLSVGGWNLGSAPFTAIVATAELRSQFATTSLAFLKKNKFDGLDIDWEYPGSRASPQIDKTNYILLLKELHGVLKTENLLLTAAVAAGKGTIDDAYDVPNMAKYLNFMMLMSYDLHGSWESFTGHNSPLYKRDEESDDQAKLNVHFAANYWVDLGMPKHKIVIGLPTYGRSFTLTSLNANGFGAPTSGPGLPGKYTREKGFLAYYEICDLIINQNAVVVRDPEHRVPYIRVNDQWIGYDDETSLREKVRYMKDNNFGGVMIWALDLDDFTGKSCGKTYPLMNAIIGECGVTGQFQGLEQDESGQTIDEPYEGTSNIDGGEGTSNIDGGEGTSNIDGGEVNDDGPPDEVEEATGALESSDNEAQNEVISNGLADLVIDSIVNRQPAIETEPERQPAIEPEPESHPVIGHIGSSYGFANYCKRKPTGLYADFFNCKYYYSCFNTYTYHMACARGTVFNEKKGICDWKNNVPRCRWRLFPL